jgi:hypothetical protein
MLVRPAPERTRILECRPGAVITGSAWFRKCLEEEFAEYDRRERELKELKGE